jgi:hypothetical protein
MAAFLGALAKMGSMAMKGTKMAGEADPNIGHVIGAIQKLRARRQAPQAPIGAPPGGVIGGQAGAGGAQGPFGPVW